MCEKTAEGRRCVLVCGAPIERYDEVRQYLSPEDYYIFCDGGLYHMERLGVTPDLIVGDFDSHPKPDLPVETIVLPCEKDDTDSGYGIKEGLKRGCTSFLLLGAAGARLDHTLGNLSQLLLLDTLGQKALLVDDYSEMEIVSREPAYIESRFAFFSLVNLSGVARDVTIRDAKYPLEHAEIPVDGTYAVSNEPLRGKTACVTVGEGRLLLIRDRR